MAMTFFNPYARSPVNDDVYLGYHTDSSNFPPPIVASVTSDAMTNAGNSGARVMGLGRFGATESIFLIVRTTIILTDDLSPDLDIYSDSYSASPRSSLER